MPHSVSRIGNRRWSGVLFISTAMMLLCSSSTTTLAQQVNGAAKEKTALDPDREIVFKKTPQGKLRIHTFQPNEWKSTDQRGAIVFFFGGGWSGGSPKQFYPQARHMAEQGMVAFCAEYRVSRRHKTSPFECVEDGKSAVSFIRDHAAELGIDPNRVVAAGGSAGGHIAICTALIRDSEANESQTNSIPNAVIAFNPVVDTGPDGVGKNKFKGRHRELSPIDHVRTKLPPILIFHGTDDTTVSYTSVVRFGKLMTAEGNDCTVVPFNGMGHGFFNYGRNENEAYLETITLSDQFLKRHGYLSASSVQK